jgi:thiaminase
MKQTKDEFSKIFQSKFIQKLKDSLIPNNSFNKKIIVDTLILK